MPLINCGECGHEVSSKAEACPNCGAPIGGSKASPFGGFRKGVTTRPDFWHDPNVGAIGFVIVIAVVFFVFGALFGY